jgi:hypothetical protein
VESLRTHDFGPLIRLKSGLQKLGCGVLTRLPESEADSRFMNWLVATFDDSLILLLHLWTNMLNVL